ncbi:putative member of the MBOAT family of putative membrane-bound O-acyltransferase [Kockovaella imperatae]|uniref:Putative member of the MBOAT family of putative membrane-bound O-acyltransferase n=1 Tax=Kockovaella imperatae TaxID=4999 RepID=A0A1Y1UGD1_9TREE|nr:putative member of the MBOAT family of putative membrane-bound O-acyltransferase [Kockovaella imperatae]ORX36566.1 putative member of the MBOAT family of putative membrane-bound O-acyltransferase [Kockovaella imperatae]
MLGDALFEKLASVAGAPISQIKLISILLVSFPIASLYGRLPAKRYNVAHLYSLIVSLIYLVPILGLGRGTLHLLFSCIGTYLIVVILRGPLMPWTAFIFCMGHLLYNHISRLVAGTPTSEIEITFTQMVFVMNLTTFAWNVHDGRRKVEDLDTSQRATRLDHVPTPLAFLGYCFFFPSMLIGPSFDYATYDALIHRTLYQNPPSTHGAKQDVKSTTPQRRPYGRRRVAYLHLLIGLIFLGFYSTYGTRAGYDRVLTPVWKQWTWLQRFGFIQFAGFTARTKYYAVWSLAEGACILTGLGFNGYDPKTGRSLWNRVQNVNILSIESAESFKVLFDSWNCRTNVWLRDCVYKRLTTKGKKPGTIQSMATFMTSALWVSPHGVEPGYHLAFVTAGMLTSLGRQYRHFVRPYFLPPAGSSSSLSKRVYDLIGWFMVQSNLNYVVAPFMLLSFRNCMTAWSRMGWYSHIIIALSMAFFQLGGRRRLRKGMEGRQAKTKPSFKLSPPSPMVDEKQETDFKWVRHALENQGEKGVHADGGFVDRVMRGAETPGTETPRTVDEEPFVHKQE